MKATPRVVGLLTAVVLALGIVVPAGAQAKSFTSSGNVSMAVSGTQSGTNTLEIEGSTVTCKTASFATAGEVFSPTFWLTVHPSFGECTAFGFVGATVSTTNCDYVLSDGFLEIVCSALSNITITAGTCEVRIGSQTLLGAEFTNLASSPATIDFDTDNHFIRLVKVKDGFLCPLGGTGEGTGIYHGSAIMKATHAGTAVGLKME